MKTKLWILLLAVLLVCCICLSVFFFLPREAEQAQIFSDGQLLHTLDLRIDTELTVQLGNGTNTVTVKDGKIAVTQANCPDHYCMKRGYCSGGTQIVCLPNRLVIRFLHSQEIDGAVG